MNKADVIERLEEMETYLRNKSYSDLRARDYCECVGYALELLREQKPVKPIKTPETIRAEYNCGKCTAPVGIMFHDGDWYYKADYCPRCGKKVKWDAGN